MPRTAIVTPPSHTPPAPSRRKPRLRVRRLLVRLSPRGAEITRLHDTLRGQLAIEECAFLYNAARGCREIVEIGSFRGKSCTILALGSVSGGAPGARVTAIDPHLPHEGRRWSREDHDIFMQTLRDNGVAERVNHLCMFSHDALAQWDGRPIDLLWIDGDHSFEGVQRDLLDWTPFVPVGGLLACHDAFGNNHPGVLRAWDATIKPSGEFSPMRRTRSIAWARRRV